MSIKVVVDSSVDLPEEILKKLDVEVVPLTVTFGDDHYLDRVEMSSEEFYNRMSIEKELPKTAQPAPGRFLEVFEKYGKIGYQIICLCLSSGLSGTYNSALLAKSMSDAEVEVIDTKSGSAGIGILTYLSAKWAEVGKSLQQITADIKEYAENLTVYALLETVENAVKGGRLSPIKGVIANLLNLKVIVEVNDGKVNILEKVRGTKKAYERLLQLVEEKAKDKVVPLVGLAHVANEKGTLILKEMLQQVFIEAEIFQTTMSGTIGTYAGKGGIVLAF